MFKRFYSAIVDKISNLNPITPFIKYALNKFLKELINDDIKLQDFKNGCLSLVEIEFNCQKINNKHLVSSPYIIHKGKIGKLKVQLPSLLQINQKPIQIQVNQVVIQLKPNKHFYENFKQRMRQIQQDLVFQDDQMQQQEQLSQNCPMDYFKQSLKQILLNIKVKIQNVVVKVYMNNPQNINQNQKNQSQKNLKNNNLKKQYYLMFRIPIINIHKNTQSSKAKNLKQKQNDTQSIKLNIQLPQFSIHLLNTDYSQKTKQYPFNYPTVHHPDTILLFGLTTLQKIENVLEKDQSVPRLKLAILTDYKKKTRQLKIQGLGKNIQVMINPIQLKILSRFTLQIKQFKNILDYVKHQLNMEQQIIRLSQNGLENSNIMSSSGLRRNKSGENKNIDIFTSIISISDFSSSHNSNLMSHSKLKKKSNQVFQSIIKQNPSLQKSVNDYSKFIKQQISKQNLTQQINQQLRIVNFKNQVQINIQVNQVILYLLKRSQLTSFNNSQQNQISNEKKYLRKWMYQYKQKRLNQSIGIDYFMFLIKQIKFSSNQNAKLIQISIDKLKLQNVKIKNQNQNSAINMKLNNKNIINENNCNKEVTGNNNQINDEYCLPNRISNNFSGDSNQQLFISCNEQVFYSMSSLSLNKSNIKNEQITQAQIKCIQQSDNNTKKNRNSIDINNNHNKIDYIQQKQIIQFKLTNKTHFCIQQILRISQKPAQNYYSNQIRKYDFLPHQQKQNRLKQIRYKPGFNFIQNKLKKPQINKIQIQQISACFNAQIIKQLCQIIYPVQQFYYNLKLRKNHSNQNQNSSQIIQSTTSIQKKIDFSNLQQKLNEDNKKMKISKKSIFQSQFHFNRQYHLIQDFVQRKQKPLLKISIQQINLGFYQSKSQIFKELVQKSKKRKQFIQQNIKNNIANNRMNIIKHVNKNNLQLQKDQINNNINNQKKSCFCNLSTRQFYFECFGIQIDKNKDDFKISISKIVSGLVQLQNSKIISIQPLFQISSQTSPINANTDKLSSTIRICLQKNESLKTQNVYLFVPNIRLDITQKQTINVIQIIKQHMKIFDSLKSYSKYLKNQMQSITLLQKHHNNYSHTNNQNLNNLKSKQKKQYQTTLNLYVQSFNITFLQIQLIFKNIYFFKESNKISFKFAKFFIAIKQNIQVFLNQMKNQQLYLRQYLNNQNRDNLIEQQGIAPQNLILQIYDQQFKVKPFQTKNRIQFFTQLSSLKTSFQLIICKNLNPSHSSAQQNSQKKRELLIQNRQFKFNKRPISENKLGTLKNVLNQNKINPIDQQQQQKIIQLSLNKNINIYVVNLCRIIDKKQVIEGFVKKIQKLIKQIKQQSPQIKIPSQRKKSIDSDIQKTQQIKITITKAKINIDIRPTFQQKTSKRKIKKNNKMSTNLINNNNHSYSQSNSQKNHPQQQQQIKQLIFSNTRSFLQFQWELININISKRTQTIKFDTILNLNYYFLVCQDRQPLKNPLIIKKQQLKILGFLQLFLIKNIILNFQIIKDKKTLKCSIQQLFGQIGIQTIQYLKLHFQHLTKHNIQRKFGMTQKQKQQKFYQIQIIDMQELKQKANNKQQQNLLFQDAVYFDSAMQINDDQQEIQDITQAYQKYTEKLQFKKKSQSKFKQKKFIPSIDNKDKQRFQMNKKKQIDINQNKQLFVLQYFLIKQVHLKLNYQNDFDFISCQTLNQSKEKKRTRKNNLTQNDMLKYLQLRINMLNINAQIKQDTQNQLNKQKINKSQINQSQLNNNKLNKYTTILQSFIRLQSIQLNYSTRKQSDGFFKRLINHYGKKNTSNINYEQIIFPFLKSQDQIKIIIEISQKKVYIKFNKNILQLGFTSDILQFVKKIKQTQKKIIKSGWKKVYNLDKQIHIKKQYNTKQEQNLIEQNQLQDDNSKQKQIQKQFNEKERLLLILFPQIHLIMTIVYKGIMVLPRQSLSTTQFLLHEQIGQKQLISNKITQWVKDLILKNVGGLIAGSALKLIGTVAQQILELVKFFLSFMCKSNDRNY